MGAGEFLRRLDRAALPPLGRALSWFLLGPFRRRVVMTTGVLGTTGLLVASVWAAHEPPTTYRSAGAVIRVGVSEGQSVASYTEQAGRKLAALAREGVAVSYALVSFDAYLSPERARMLVGGVSVHRVYLRAHVSGARADVVEITVGRTAADLTAEMRRLAVRRAGQERSYRRDAAKLTGSSEVERRHRESYLAKADAAAAEAAAYRSLCSCVFAVVIRGSTPALDRLARMGGVRAVDPAPELTDLGRAVFVPPLPEQPGDPAPSSPAVPSGSPSPPPPPSASPTPSRTPSSGPPPPSDPTPSASRSSSGSHPPPGGAPSPSEATTYGGEAGG